MASLMKVGSDMFTFLWNTIFFVIPFFVLVFCLAHDN